MQNNPADNTKKVTEDTAFLEKKKKRKKIVFWSLIGVIILTIVYGNYGAYQMFVIKRQKSNLEREIAELKKQQAELIKIREKAKSDLTYIEKIAREKHSMVKPGEHVYQVITKDKETKK
jgi:cell division protein FtsB